MPFAVVSGVSRGMGVLDRGRDRRRQRVIGVNVGHLTVTNGHFVALFSAVMGSDAALPKLLWHFLSSNCRQKRKKTLELNDTRVVCI